MQQTTNNQSAVIECIQIKHAAEAATTTIPKGLWRFYPQNFEITGVSDSSIYVADGFGTKIINLSLTYSASPVFNVVNGLFDWTYADGELLFYSNGTHTIGQVIDTPGVNLVTFDCLLMRIG